MRSCDEKRPDSEFLKYMNVVINKPFEIKVEEIYQKSLTH